MRVMKYKDFVFPHNPQKIQISAQGRTARHCLPGMGEVVQNIGRRCRTIRGEGSFFGNMAGEYAQRLESLQRSERWGYLYLPGFEPMKAYFTAVEILCEGDGQIYSYHFEFTEAQRTKGGQEYDSTAIFSSYS